MLPSLSSLNVAKLSDNLVFICFAAFLIKIYFFSQPFVRGFHCDDDSIRRPLEPLTVNLATIIIMSTVIPILVMWLTEVRFERDPGFRLKRFAFSSLTNLTTTLFFKFAVGRLRPHFLAVCRPNVDCSKHSGQFIDSHMYKCLNLNQREVSQARQSFFSGHASISMNAAIYLIIYLHVHYERSLIKSLAQFAILLVGLYPGITQYNNYWHHWDDVVVGHLVGTACAALNYQLV